MKRFLRKALRWAGILFATFIVLLLVFYAEEDWRGARDWAACQRDLAARGETLDLRQLVPPGNPEDDLSKVPIFAEMYQMDAELDQQKRSKLYAVARLPKINVLINYDSPFETNLGPIVKNIEIAKVIQLEGIAHLDNHEADAAEKDYLFSFDINRPLSKGCFLVNYLVIVAIRGIDDSILWEGIHQHLWNDSQLREMESALSMTDMLALGVTSFQIERASALKTMEAAQKDTGFIRQAMANGGDNLLYLTANVRPGGWWNEDRLFCAQGIQGYIDAIDLNQQRLSPDAFNLHLTPNSQGYYPDFDTNIWRQIYTPMGETALYGSRRMGFKIAKAETYRRLARLACRLEEYRLAHNNQYPDKLEDLPDLPAHLNQEVLSMQPLQYHRQGDGYALYSLGWNQKDDGGVYNGDPKLGDWPWPSP